MSGNVRGLAKVVPSAAANEICSQIKPIIMAIRIWIRETGSRQHQRDRRTRRHRVRRGRQTNELQLHVRNDRRSPFGARVRQAGAPKAPKGRRRRKGMRGLMSSPAFRQVAKRARSVTGPLKRPFKQGGIAAMHFCTISGTCHDHFALAKLEIDIRDRTTEVVELTVLVQTCHGQRAILRSGANIIHFLSRLEATSSTA